MRLQPSISAERELARLERQREQREARAYAFYQEQLRQGQRNRAAWLLKQRIRIAVAKLARVGFNRSTPEVTGRTLWILVGSILIAGGLLYAFAFIRGL